MIATIHHIGLRRCESWVDAFIQYTDRIQSPLIFRKWAAISLIAAAMERKVWVVSSGRRVYPNLYIFLVGPPGIGKTWPAVICHEFVEALEDHYVAPVSLTKASLMDQLKAAERVLSYPHEDVFNSLYVSAKELGALLPGYDSDFNNALTYIYDCLKYDEDRRGAKEPLVIERPQINLLGCTTPSYLLDTMPPTAWDQGFLSRVMIAYSSEMVERKYELLDDMEAFDEGIYNALVEDFKKIAALSGRLRFTRPAVDILDNWRADKKNTPSHPRLINYSIRRPIHVLKLCQVATVDTGAKEIGVPEARRAIDWIMELEKTMADVFSAMASGGDSAVINDCWQFAMKMAVRQPDQILPSHLVWDFLKDRCPANTVYRLVEVMIRGNILRPLTSENLLFKVKGV